MPTPEQDLAEDLSARVRRLEDLHAIGQLRAHYCQALDDGRWDALVDLFTPDGAFVGRLVSRQEIAVGRSRFTFAVERSVKGALGSTVDVESASDGAACGIETPIGSRIGLFLERRDVRAELDRPLDQTLTAPLTPSVGQIRADEQRVIDRATRSRLYQYSYLQSQDGSPVMVLTPALSG